MTYFNRFALAATAVFSTHVFSADLTIYTYDSFNSEWGPGPQLEKIYEAKCQCDIEFIGENDGVSILNRARIEKSNTKADVLLGLDESLMKTALDEGLVQTHKTDLSQLTSSLNWDNTHFVPFDYGYFAFIYNQDTTPNPVGSLKELVDSNASVIYQDPRTSTPGQGLLFWVNAVYGDQSAQAWTQLAKHTVTVTKGWWEAYSMFLEGDADYVLSYTTSPAYHEVVDGTSNYKAAEFSEGHIRQVEVAAISAFSKRPEHAEDFLNFLISPEAQAIIPTTNWMLPVIDNVELPDAFEHIISPKEVKTTLESLVEQRSDFIKVWRVEAQ
jgi:thiamine transport system substrate-binding protein